jgi:hypothetical protein
MFESHHILRSSCLLLKKWNMASGLAMASLSPLTIIKGLKIWTNVGHSLC